MGFVTQLFVSSEKRRDARDLAIDLCNDRAFVLDKGQDRVNRARPFNLDQGFCAES
jgi:hypothetical protein